MIFNIFDQEASKLLEVPVTEFAEKMSKAEEDLMEELLSSLLDSSKIEYAKDLYKKI